MGKDAFPKYTLAVQTARSRVQSVPLRGVLVVADANGNLQGSFDAIVKALGNANFPQPTKPFKIEEANGVRAATYVIPGPGETGTLEHLLLRAIIKQSPHLEQCLKDFSVAVEV
jgi:hypothetical protein